MPAPSVGIPSELVRALRAAREVAVLTGAGVSAESGVPTFRDALTGLWSRFDPEELATPDAFRRDPALVWSWYAERRAAVARAQPNPAHVALVEIEARVPRFTLVTQNVDGLHRRAGSRRVLEIHGDITRVRCSGCARPAESWDETAAPPACGACGEPLRPDVVWFGEMLPEAALNEAMDAARSCDVFLSVGTSSLVHPAAGLPEIALASGAVVVEVNPSATPLTSRVAFSLRGPAGVVLPALVDAWSAPA
jgi:NAD-dependent deacetylase